MVCDCQLPLTKHEEFKAAVSAAKQAFPSWRNTPITTRQRVMLKLQELIRRDMDKLAMNITTEQGKTLKDAQGDVFRGLEVVEHASRMASLQMGEFSSNVSHGIDTYSIREPIGVCASICPFNFPAMIPLWMFRVAVTCGNTFVLKPSEKDPGWHAYIYSRASAKGKRVQSNMGAKNHGIVMPDANIDATLNALVAAGFGAAGQRGLSFFIDHGQFGLYWVSEFLGLCSLSCVLIWLIVDSIWIKWLVFVWVKIKLRIIFTKIKLRGTGYVRNNRCLQCFWGLHWEQEKIKNWGLICANGGCNLPGGSLVFWTVLKAFRCCGFGWGCIKCRKMTNSGGFMVIKALCAEFSLGGIFGK